MLIIMDNCLTITIFDLFLEPTRVVLADIAIQFLQVINLKMFGMLLVGRHMLGDQTVQMLALQQ